MIVRWGLDALPEVVAEAGIEEPLLIASPRWTLPIDAATRWSEVPSHRVEDATALAGDGVIAVGGGSAIDLGKAVSAAANVPLVSVPTTYAGATRVSARPAERTSEISRAGSSPSTSATATVPAATSASIALREMNVTP